MAGSMALVGVRPRDRACHLADQLRVSHRPVTLMFRDCYGIDLHPELVRCGHGTVSDSEAASLGVRPGTPCRWRTARLVTKDGRTAAGAFLLWLPGVLSPAARLALDAAAEPAGAILAREPGGMHREEVRAVAAERLDEITGEIRSVVSRAVLVTRAGPAGYAEESWLSAFTGSLP